MTDKTLGQIAYEAAAELWEHDNEAAWQAAAEAVVEQASGGPVGSPGAELADAIARARVIEAAKAWSELHYDTGVEFVDDDEEQAFAEQLGESDSHLWQAVEALIAAEQEGEVPDWKRLYLESELVVTAFRDSLNDLHAKLEALVARWRDNHEAMFDVNDFGVCADDLERLLAEQEGAE